MQKGEGRSCSKLSPGIIPRVVVRRPHVLKRTKTMPKARKYEYPQPEDRLLKDLEAYKNYALEIGASDAKIIRSVELIFDSRAWRR